MLLGAQDTETPTGTCAVLIKDKERSLCANLAAANNYKKDHLDSVEIQDVVKAAKVYYISGFFMTVSPPSIMSVAKHSFENKKVWYEHWPAVAGSSGVDKSANVASNLCLAILGVADS